MLHLLQRWKMSLQSIPVHMLKTIQWFSWVRNLYSSLLIYDRDLKSMVSGMTVTNIFALALPQYSFLLNRLPDGDMLTLRREEPGRLGRKKFNGFLMISIQMRRKSCW
jgi:hypothetical protein